MTENPDHGTERIELSDADQADLQQMFAEPDGQAMTFHPILMVWREVLSPAEGEMTTKPTPQWCNRITTSYQGIAYADMYTYRDAYYSKVIELKRILEDEIATDEECLTYTTPEEDVEHNSEHYRNLLISWQVQMLQWELDWDCLDPNAEVEIAALSEIHKMFFSQNGLTEFLSNIKFEYTEADQAALGEALESRRVEVTGE